MWGTWGSCRQRAQCHSVAHWADWRATLAMRTYDVYLHAVSRLTCSLSGPWPTVCKQAVRAPCESQRGRLRSLEALRWRHKTSLIDSGRRRAVPVSKALRGARRSSRRPEARGPLTSAARKLRRRLTVSPDPYPMRAYATFNRAEGSSAEDALVRSRASLQPFRQVYVRANTLTARQCIREVHRGSNCERLYTCSTTRKGYSRAL